MATVILTIRHERRFRRVDTNFCQVSEHFCILFWALASKAHDVPDRGFSAFWWSSTRSTHFEAKMDTKNPAKIRILLLDIYTPCTKKTLAKLAVIPIKYADLVFLFCFPGLPLYLYIS